MIGISALGMAASIIVSFLLPGSRQPGKDLRSALFKKTVSFNQMR
jgi:hypothetical protein